MKILILALPRCATKFLAANLKEYLKSIDSKVIDVPPEFFVIRSNPDFKYKANVVDGKIVMSDELIDDNIHSQLTELNRRRELLEEVRGSCVVKHFLLHASKDYVPRLEMMFHRVYTIHRSDVFEQALSRAISEVTEQWAPGVEQQLAISNLTQEKITVDVDKFIRFLTRVNALRELYRSHHYVIDYSKIIKVTNAKEFCELLSIPVIDFNFTPSEVEYGHHKFDMVTNITELRNAYVRFFR